MNPQDKPLPKSPYGITVCHGVHLFMYPVFLAKQYY